MIQCKTMVLAGIIAVTVFACGGSSNDRSTNSGQGGTSTEPLKYVLIARIDDRVHPTDRQFIARAEVLEFEAPVVRQDFVASVNEIFSVSEDRCEDIGDQDFEPSPAAIEAGETAVISSSNGTFATLPLLIENGEPHYEYGYIETTEHTPNGLTIEFPGSNFSDLTLPLVDITPLTLIEPTPGVEISALTELKWEPDNANSLYLYFNNGVHAAGCELVDDGSFTFPESVVAEFDTPGASGQINIERTKISMIDSGDTLFISVRESEWSNWESFTGVD